MNENSIGRRVRELSHLTAEQLSPTPPPPISCKVELTSRCNFKCSYCAHTQGLRPSKDMDRELYSRILKETRAFGVRRLGTFFLGESFLLPWLPEAVAEAKAAGFEQVFLTTNGSVMKSSMIEAVFEAGLDSLKFSLNYGDAKQMNEIAGVKEDMFDRVTRNVKRTQRIRDAMGSKCWLAGSYISYNNEQGRRMRDRLQELNPYLDEFYPLPLYDQGGLVAIDEDKIKWTGNPGHLSAPVAPMPCWVLFSQAHVQYDGKVSACCFDHGNDFEMGDLKEKSFAEIWRGEKFQALRQAHLNNDVRGTACEKCIYG